MDAEQRKIAIVTFLGKKYSGYVDVPNSNFRTTDLLNSANIYWKNPNEKCYDDAILMSNVKLYTDNSLIYKRFDKIQIKLSEIIYFYDDIQSLGDEMEKKRAATMIMQTQEIAQEVTIITKVVASSFYDISGIFFGLFRKKSRDRFISLTQVKIAEIHNRPGKWTKREIPLPHNFIGISNQNIESVTIN
jgi:hypothetical protein